METGSFNVFGGAAKTAYDTYVYLKKFKDYQVDVFADLSRLDSKLVSLSLKELKPDYYDVVLLNSIRDVSVVSKCLNPRNSKTKFVYTDRGNVLDNYKKGGVKKLLPKMMLRQYFMFSMRRWLDCYVALSAEQCESAKAFFDKKVMVKFIPNWYGDEFKKIGGIKKTGSAIYVGRLDERQKKVEFLIRGIAKVVSKYGSLKDKKLLKIVGSGPDEAAYKALVGRLGLKENIDFYGFLRIEELIGLFNSSLFFVSTSEWEGMSGTFVEAMACGLPLLINRQNNTVLSYNPRKDLVTSESDGLIYDYGNLEDFAEKFHRLYSNNQFRKKLSDSSYAFSKRFSMAKSIGQYRKIIEEL